MATKIGMQWHVTKSAKKQWAAYKAMIEESEPAWIIPGDREHKDIHLPRKRHKTESGTMSNVFSTCH